MPIAQSFMKCKGEPIQHESTKIARKRNKTEKFRDNMSESVLLYLVTPSLTLGSFLPILAMCKPCLGSERAVKEENTHPSLKSYI